MRERCGDKEWQGKEWEPDDLGSSYRRLRLSGSFSTAESRYRYVDSTSTRLTDGFAMIFRSAMALHFFSVGSHESSPLPEASSLM